MNAPKPRRRWYQFSLRTFFVLVTLACVGFGWWVHRSKEWIRLRHDVLLGVTGHSNGKNWDAFAAGDSITAPGMLWLFGEKGLSDIYIWWGHAQAADEVKLLFPEAKVMYPGMVDDS